MSKFNALEHTKKSIAEVDKFLAQLTGIRPGSKGLIDLMAKSDLYHDLPYERMDSSDVKYELGKLMDDADCISDMFAVFEGLTNNWDNGNVLYNRETKAFVSLGFSEISRLKNTLKASFEEKRKELEEDLIIFSEEE